MISNKKIWVLATALLLCFSMAFGQRKGKLFIIGGGDRSDELMRVMVKIAELKTTDYIVVLPMSSSVPEESIAIMQEQLARLCSNPVTGFRFTRNDADNRKEWIDSVRHARIIYISGGDQNRFMDVVRGTALYTAMHEAYSNGSTVAGTSAGAAVMSQVMITGNEKEKPENGSFREVKKDNVITSDGMGFLTSAVIDQHFIWRSRYNRLISILVDHPGKKMIGIDEATAVVVDGKKAEVVGESQVILISKPKTRGYTNVDKPGFRNAKLSLLVAGDKFKLK